MAVFEHARPAPFGARATYQVVGFVWWLIEEARVALNAYRVHDALKQLNRDQLLDIGLGDGDLMAQARDIARRVR